MRILLFGKGGQLGWELQRSLAPLGELVALDFDHCGELCADFTNLPGLAETVRRVAPPSMDNVAAHSAVDKADNEPDLGCRINDPAPAVELRRILREHLVKVKGRKTLEEADAKAATPVWQANPSPPIILKRP